MTIKEYQNQIKNICKESEKYSLFKLAEKDNILKKEIDKSITTI